MIRQMGYSGYFLIVWDFIRYAREEGIPVGPGRGSAAGSLVAWCMRITDVDPIDFDLIFERFLNPERVSMPDIDVDFCERRRGEVIDYVTRKYGRENVAQIITFGTMKAKAVVRDVGRALDMPYADVDRIAKQIPPALDMTLDKALAENPVLKDMAAKDAEGEGGHRHRQAPRRDVAPCLGARRRRGDRAGSDHRLRAALQGGARRNHDAVEHEGGRADRPPEDGLPGAEHADAHRRLRSKEIKRTEGIELDIDTIPLDDPKTYKVFGEGAAYGIFQFESSGMRELLRKAKPERLDDLIALNALYRPGPLKSGMVDDWVARKQGKTRGQVRAAAARADPLGHLRRHRLSGAGDAHRAGAGRLHPRPGRRAAQGHGQEGPEGHGEAARGVHGRRAAPRASTRRRPTKIFELMEYFAGYGFNKSHSTAYAFLAYQTAYLKANYPWHFAAALLTIEAQNTDKLAMYLAESARARHSGAAARHQPEPAAFLGGAGQGRPLRPDGDQGARRGRGQRDPRRARRSSAGGFRRCTRCARSSTCASPTSACSRRW